MPLISTHTPLCNILVSPLLGHTSHVYYVNLVKDYCLLSKLLVWVVFHWCCSIPELSTGVRRSRQNLEFGSAHFSSTSALQLPSTSSQVASDYLVPLPSWRSHKQKVQPSYCQKPTSLQQSYEITLSYSHEYEELRDIIEESGTQIDGYINESPTFEVLQVASPPLGGEYISSGDVPVRMKRNAAYRMYSTVNGNENLRRDGYCNEVTISNPLNCLYAAQHSTNEQQSNLE